MQNLLKTVRPITTWLILGILFAIPQSLRADFPIELDLTRTHQLEAKPIGEGEYSIVTTGRDPYVMSKRFDAEYDPDQQFTLSFEYISATKQDPVVLYFGPPIGPKQLAAGTPVPASKTWTSYALDIRARQIPGSWRGGYTRFRLDFGNTPERAMQIRKLQLRAPNAREREAAEAKRGATEAKKAIANTREQISFLENEHIRLGADLAIGGAITHLSTKNGPNMVNSYDWGREIQMSFYSGPRPFEPNGKTPHPNWAQLGWNPIQSGDSAGNASTVLEHRNDGEEIYVKCRPLHWPHDNQPAQCTFECWYRLDGNVVRVRSRLVNARDDKTQYTARSQELPAIYSNGPWFRLFTYTGTKPYTGGSLTEVPHKPNKPPFPWNRFQATEEWAALVDETGQGFGVWTPGAQNFLGGFAGKPGSGGPDDNPTGYLAPLHREILDHNIDYRYEYQLIVGSVDEIRDHVYRNREKAPTLEFHFDTGRRHWSYWHAVDTGWPIEGGLEMIPEEDHATLNSPTLCLDAASVTSVRLRAAFSTGEKTARFKWTRFGEKGFPGENRVLFPVVPDGEMRDYEIPLGNAPAWRGTIIRLALNPCLKGGESKRIRIESIALRGEKE